MSSTSTDWRRLYPFESHYLDRGPLRYHYLDEGRGEPVVMVHGNPTWSFYFRELIIALRGDYRCIACDHIGCGLSDKPGDDGYSYRLKSRVDDLDALMEHLGLTENVTLVLHDWGGMIGMAWALRRPERIKRLVLMNTAAFLLPQVVAQSGHRLHPNCGTGVPPVSPPARRRCHSDIHKARSVSTSVAPVSKSVAPVSKTVAPVSNRCGRPAKRLPLRLRLLHGGGPFASVAVRGFNLFSRAAVSMATTKRLAPDVRAGLMAPYDSWKNRIATLRFVEDIPLSPKHPSYALAKSVDESIKRFADVPMLICWGERDFVFDADFLAEWRRRFPKAEVHTFPDAGHYVLEDAGEEIIPLVTGFLSRL